MLFYDANRTLLSNLTREDVMKIMEWMLKGNVITTIDGPVNKLYAFEIFLLSHIVSGARDGQWNLSEQEKNLIERLREQKSSIGGTILNAVRQTLDVVNPFRHVQQRMLENFDIKDEELEPVFNIINSLQYERDVEIAKEKRSAVGKRVRFIRTKKWLLVIKIKRKKEKNTYLG